MKKLPIPQPLVQSAALLGVLALLVAVFGIASEGFLKPATFSIIANQIPALTCVAVGMTLVLIIGGIDLSVGAVLAVSSAVLGVLMKDYEWSLSAAMLVCLLTGALCGLFNGLISVGMRVPAFIVTLGMLEIARGAAKLLTNSQIKFIGKPVEAVGEPLAGLGISPAFLLAVAAVVIAQFVLTRTVFGRYCLAIGSNAEAVRLSGIRVAPYSIAVFVMSGLLAGIAGLIETSRLSSADPNGAVGLELPAIAACVIGGTSLMGGRGNVVNSFLGVLIIRVLQTGLAHLGTTDAMKQVITGSVIVAAVLFDAIRRRWDSSSD